MRKIKKMKNHKKREYFEILNTISKGRHRTNILKKPEQSALAFLVKHIPAWVTSDMLTFFGFCGSILTAASFVMAAYWNRLYLLLGVLGFIINWFGDSLDGRLAYYRNKPRKWYGFSLDITVDWFTTLLIGSGYAFYTEGFAKFFGVAFVVMYGWAMITTLMRYKVTTNIPSTPVSLVLPKWVVVSNFTSRYLSKIQLFIPVRWPVWFYWCECNKHYRIVNSC